MRVSKTKYVLLAIGMEINPVDGPRHLVEAYIIKSLEACPADLSHSVVWHQEFLLPSHKHVFPVRAILVVKVRLFRLLRKGPPSGEAAPVLHVFFVAGAPVFVSGLEGVFWSDNFAFEEGGKGCVFGREACCV